MTHAELCPSSLFLAGERGSVLSFSVLLVCSQAPNTTLFDSFLRHEHHRTETVWPTYSGFRWYNPPMSVVYMNPHLSKTCRGASAIYSETTVNLNSRPEVEKNWRLKGPHQESREIMKGNQHRSNGSHRDSLSTGGITFMNPALVE